tara:strand:+ start:11264 stop:11680 length:417 start_codon:yes stop_codon:yes gene_type:complete
MGFIRTQVAGVGRIPHNLRSGDGYVANVLPKAYAAETDQTITTAELSGGHILQGTTLTSDVVYTLPTSLLIEAEWPEMDVGDSYCFYVVNSQIAAFDVVIAVGAGTTKVGANNSLSVPPQGGRMFVLVKTSATTHDLY